MVCAVRSFENVNKNNTEEWLQNSMCELGFQLMTDTDAVSAVTKHRGEKDA